VGTPSTTVAHEAGNPTVVRVQRADLIPHQGGPRLNVASHSGRGGGDADVVTQAGDLTVADGEHDDVGKRELAGRCAGPLFEVGAALLERARQSGTVTADADDADVMKMVGAIAWSAQDSPDSPGGIELYDPGHAPEIGWRTTPAATA
jgi:hypothetical protein